MKMNRSGARIVLLAISGLLLFFMHSACKRQIHQTKYGPPSDYYNNEPITKYGVPVPTDTTLPQTKYGVPSQIEPDTAG